MLRGVDAHLMAAGRDDLVQRAEGRNAYAKKLAASVCGELAGSHVLC